MKTKLYFLATFVVLSLMCFNTMAQKNLLFLAEVNPPATADSLLLDSLTNNWGYTVTTVDADEFAVEADLTIYDALIINESISSSGANSFAELGYPIPCLTFEAYVVRDNRWVWIDQSDPLLWVSFQDLGPGVLTTVITDNSHYITKDYSIGEEVVWSTDVLNDNITYCAFDISAAVPGAKPLGKSKNSDLGNAGLHTLWALEEGTMVPDAILGSAPVKRTVFYNTHENALVPGTETTGLYKIIRRSLTWVLGEEPTAVRDIESGSGVKLIANPVRDMGRIQFNLKEAGMVSVSVVNLIGQQTVLRANESFSAGQNEISFSTSELNAGIYLYQLKVNNSIYSGKMYILK